MPEIVIYTRQFCGFCAMAIGLLERHGLSYVERDATGDAAMRAEMIQRAKGASTFPQIFIGERHIGGCRELFQLDSSGGLARLLSESEARP